MKKTLLILFIALSVIGFSNNVKAEDGHEAKAPALNIAGEMDAYYGYNFNGMYNNSTNTSFTNNVNSFELGMANVVFSQEVGKVGMVADFVFGPRGTAATGANTDHIKQLFVTYGLSDQVTVTGGFFSTFVGYELIEASGNFNYSTSYLFSAGPFNHGGIKVDVALTDGVGLMVGAFNDSGLKTDAAGGIDDFGAQLALTPNDELGAYINVFHQGLGNGETSTELDLTATFQASKEMMLGLNAAYTSLSQNDGQSWMGAALYLNYMLSDDLGLGVRGEYFDDGDDIYFGSGATDGQSVIALTASANIKSGPLTLIPEIRFDSASEDVFVDGDGKATGSSIMALLAAVYKF